VSKWHYGGQALLEGVMIRGRQVMAIAVRDPQGNIVLHDERLPPVEKSWKTWPFLRGIFGLWDTLNLGMRALNYSANVALGESEYKVGPAQMAGVVALSLVFAVALFFVTPLLLVQVIRQLVVTSWLQVVLEGLVRLAIVLLYFIAVSQLRDIKRVFAYHGAEHKAVNALEAGANLDVESVRPFSTAHTRCGTAFLLLVVVLSIPLFAPLGGLPLAWRVLSRVVLVPVLAGVSYEVMRLGATYFDRPVVRALMAPALLLQRISARPPDDGMVEVAVAALKRAVELDAAAPST
jgi:uncharacterized protein YqhQ